MPGSFLLTAYKINLNDPKDCGPFHRVHLKVEASRHKDTISAQYWRMAKSLTTESSLILWIGAFMPTLARAPASRYLSRKQRFCHANSQEWLMGCRFSAETMSLGKVAPTVRQLFSHRGMEGSSKLANLMWAMTRPLSNFPAQANACCSRDHIFKKLVDSIIQSDWVCEMRSMSLHSISLPH